MMRGQVAVPGRVMYRPLFSTWLADIVAQMSIEYERIQTLRPLDYQLHVAQLLS